MLSPATFIGIAKAIGTSGQPALPRPAPAVPSAASHSPVEPSTAGSVQRVRVLSNPPLSVTTTPMGGTRPPVTTSASPPAAPPRNLPRGSLLDLSV
jgi:hypothetical protein